MLVSTPHQIADTSRKTFLKKFPKLLIFEKVINVKVYNFENKKYLEDISPDTVRKPKTKNVDYKYFENEFLFFKFSKL